MLLSKYFEDIEVGEVEVSRRRTITEADINQFANLTWDIHPLHTDEGYAQSTIFKGRIAHGYLILSYAGALAIPTSPGPLLANYGVDRLRFVRPCRIGDSIFVEQKVVEKEDKQNGMGVVTLELKVKNQAEQDLVLLVQKVLVASKDL
ncbi:dehydratase [Peribacillus cavernae]|uniref:Dehydratase n=1 Tax=Peribacillus cavernae TaxID=1674310 RepID=A0A3S0U2I4_9BACI|nr:MaoC/PaaZ C-terminal domain-containing protein [Peribacillus cavernae]MDQ0218102.1 acyl dehydratase [Peribacillus cavernae]RUQ32741.1 dehydratase [Peribacillus cavernae]